MAKHPEKITHKILVIGKMIVYLRDGNKGRV